MTKNISRVCAVAVAIVAGSASAVYAQAPYQQGVLTSAVNEYTNDLDQSMSGSWNGGDACADGCCDDDDGCCDDGRCGNDCCSTCGCDPGCFTDNLELFMGGDGWANHGDDDDGNNFGYRLGANSAFGGSNIRFQLGASAGFYNFHGREDEPGDTPSERQIFVTGGVFKRSDVRNGDRFSWGVVYDYMNSNNWGEAADNIDLAQIRGRFGYAVNRSNEWGVWAAIGIDDDDATNLGATIEVQAKDQINIYWTHQFEYGAETMLYVGLADEPNGNNPIISSPDLKELVLGVRGRAPMNRWLALYGNVHYILPGTTGGDNSNNNFAEEVWNVSVGLVFYPGAKARSRSVSGPAGLPLIPVADNGTFAVNTPAGNL